jgi:hypothetical protein
LVTRQERINDFTHEGSLAIQQTPPASQRRP